jgi:hypothetical protein
MKTVQKHLIALTLSVAMHVKSLLPTLTEWGVIIFITVMIGIGVVILRKRRMV